jgi:hypothetical protein
MSGNGKSAFAEVGGGVDGSAGMQVIPDSRVTGSKIPFRYKGQMPLIKQDDRLQPEIVKDAKARVFDLSNAKDLEAYQAIIHRVGRGTSAISVEERNWSDKRDCYVVFLRWLDLFTEIPEGDRHGIEIK